MKRAVGSFGLGLMCTALAAEIRTAPADPVENEMAQGRAAHARRNLGEASRLYRDALKAEPPVDPSANQMVQILRFAPRLGTVAGEFFPLKDVVAIVHPGRPVIGYHLFWEDDIAYPADNEPSDHEIVWIEFNPATQQVTKVWAYFHGRLLESPAAVTDANAHDGHAWIGVEWGFHGSVPFGAMSSAEAKLREHWQLAHHGNFHPHPLARGWPTQFDGSFEDYVRFAAPVDPRSLLAERRLVYVTRWADAVINQDCLRYNFAAKPDWPWLVAAPPSPEKSHEP